MEIESRVESSEGVPKMLNRSLLVIVGPLGVALFLSVNLFAQNSSTQTWPDPVVLRPPVAEGGQEAGSAAQPCRDVGLERRKPGERRAVETKPRHHG